MKKTFIYAAFFAALSVGSPAFASTDASLPVSPHFEVQIKNNQGEDVMVRVMNLEQLPRPTSSVIKNIPTYDRKLPFVDYSIRAPQEWKNYVKGQIAQTARKSGIKNPRSLTPQEAIRVAALITNKNLTYDKRMVEGSDVYSRSVDDQISVASLDTVVMREKRGVCRQYAAVFSNILTQVIAQSPTLTGMTVDEVASRDLNHAYNIVMIPTPEGISVGFVEPIQYNARISIKNLDALHASYDGVIAEFVQGDRFSLSSAQKESTLARLVKSNDQFTQKQATTELATLYVQNTLAESSDTASPDLLVRLSEKMARLPDTKAITSTKNLDERYKRIMGVWSQVKLFLSTAV